MSTPDTTPALEPEVSPPLDGDGDGDGDGAPRTPLELPRGTSLIRRRCRDRNS